MTQNMENGVPQPQVWDGIRKDAQKLVNTNRMAFALADALRDDRSFNAKLLERKLALEQVILPRQEDENEVRVALATCLRGR